MPTRLTVTGRAALTDHLVRVTFAGDLAGFAESTHTDRYVKLIFAPEGTELTETTDLRRLQATLPPEQAPVVRTYTVRQLDVARGALAIDFVVHGDEGIAGPWAASAEPGDVLWANGPGGAYAPDPTADAHLLVGDESALPAVAAAVEALPADARGHVLVEVAGPGDEMPLPVPDGMTLRWLHRGTPAHETHETHENHGTPRTGADAPMVAAVRALTESDGPDGWPAGRVQVFVHGEGDAVMHHVRPLLKARGVARGDLSVSAYWRRGRTEDGFRVWKQDLAKAEDAG